MIASIKCRKNRMAMTKIFLTAVGILLTQMTFAQIPGYMGKRISIQAEVSTSLIWQNNYSDANQNGNIIKPLVKPTISIDYALTRKRSIALVSRFYSMPYALSAYDMNYAKPSGYFYGDNPEMNVFHAGIQYRMFGKSGLNPLGKFTYVGLDVVTHQAIDGDKLFYRYDPNTLELIFYEDVDNQTHLAAGLTFGMQNQFRLFDKLMCKYGAEFLFLFNGWGYGRHALGKGDQYGELDDFFKSYGAASIRTSNMFGFNLGLSYSLF